LVHPPHLTGWRDSAPVRIGKRRLAPTPTRRLRRTTRRGSRTLLRHGPFTLAPILGAADRVTDWKHTRAQIRAAILTQGWNQQANAFTQAFADTNLDASALTLPMVGFLPSDDPRVRSTVQAIATHLTDARGLVHRYRTTDGLPGGEGTFLLCTFWLAHALALAGQHTPAKQAFQTAASYANDVGLLTEEVDSLTGEPIGNFPRHSATSA
jgi:GH15 family glucan-1,4-alpha-glucosidase